MLKKKTERLIPQSDQPKKQVSRGKVTVPKNSNHTCPPAYLSCWS